MMISETPKHISPCECDTESPNLYCPQCLSALPESGACPAPCEYESGVSKAKPLTYLQMVDKKLDAMNEKLDRISKVHLQQRAYKALAGSPINHIRAKAGYPPLKGNESAFQELAEKQLHSGLIAPQEFSDMQRIEMLGRKSSDKR